MDPSPGSVVSIRSAENLLVAIVDQPSTKRRVPEREHTTIMLDIVRELQGDPDRRQPITSHARGAKDRHNGRRMVRAGQRPLDRDPRLCGEDAQCGDHQACPAQGTRSPRQRRHSAPLATGERPAGLLAVGSGIRGLKDHQFGVSGRGVQGSFGHREDTCPSEVSKACQVLNSKGRTVSEVSVRQPPFGHPDSPLTEFRVSQGAGTGGGSEVEFYLSWLINPPSHQPSWLINPPSHQPSWLINPPSHQPSWLMNPPSNRSSLRSPPRMVGPAPVLALPGCLCDNALFGQPPEGHLRAPEDHNDLGKTGVNTADQVINPLRSLQLKHICDDVFGDAIGEPAGCLVAAEIVEREHRDRGLSGRRFDRPEQPDRRPAKITANSMPPRSQPGAGAAAGRSGGPARRFPSSLTR